MNQQDYQAVGRNAMHESNEVSYSKLQTDLELLEKNFENFKSSQLNQEEVMVKQQKSMNEKFDAIILKKKAANPLNEEDINEKIIEEGKDLRLYNFTRKTAILKDKVKQLSGVIQNKNVDIGNLMVELKNTKNSLLEKEAECDHYKKLWEMRDREVKALEDGGFVDAREADARNRQANRQNVVENQRRYDEVNRMDDYNFWKTNNDKEVQKMGQRDQEIAQNRGSHSGNQGNFSSPKTIRRKFAWG